MARMTMNELRLEIAEILSEAKKKKEKGDKAKKDSKTKTAFGYYDEAFDFSAPLGAYNRYKQQGGVTWGPHTSAGTQVDTNFANPNVGPYVHESSEQALRAVIREVIQNGLVPEHSAWAPLLTRESANTVWEKADSLFEAWYNEVKKSSSKDKAVKPGNWEKTKYGDVKKHGLEKKKKKGK